MLSHGSPMVAADWRSHLVQEGECTLHWKVISLRRDDTICSVLWRAPGTASSRHITRNSSPSLSTRIRLYRQNVTRIGMAHILLQEGEESISKSFNPQSAFYRFNDEARRRIARIISLAQPKRSVSKSFPFLSICSRRPNEYWRR